jgi:hypothetical protein
LGYWNIFTSFSVLIKLGTGTGFFLWEPIFPHHHHSTMLRTHPHLITPLPKRWIGEAWTSSKSNAFLENHRSLDSKVVTLLQS